MRTGNLAALHVEQKYFGGVEHLLTEALQLDREVGHFRGMVQRMGVRGQALLQQQFLQQGAAELQKVFSTLREVDTEQVSEDEICISHQFALLNMSEAALAFGQVQEAYHLLVLSITSHRICDRGALLRALNKLKEMAETRLGNPYIAEMVTAIVRQAGSQGGAADSKDIAFSLDYSGSMVLESLVIHNII